MRRLSFRAQLPQLLRLLYSTAVLLTFTHGAVISSDLHDSRQAQSSNSFLRSSSTLALKEGQPWVDYVRSLYADPKTKSEEPISEEPETAPVKSDSEKSEKTSRMVNSQKTSLSKSQKKSSKEKSKKKSQKKSSKRREESDDGDGDSEASVDQTDLQRDSSSRLEEKVRIDEDRITAGKSRVQPHPHDEALGVKSARRRELVGVCLFLLLLCVFAGWFLQHLCVVHEKYAKAHAEIDDLDWVFKDYVWYTFGVWIGWTQNAGLKVLLAMTVLFLTLGTFAYWLLQPKAGIWQSSWLTFLWLLAPDGGVAEKTWTGAALGGIVSLLGLLIFAVLLTLVSTMFNDYMDNLKDGNNAVMEVDHLIIVGLTKANIHLLHELCEAHSVSGGVSIVLLLRGMPKEDMKAIIEDSDLPLKGSQIILRSGFPQYEADLAEVGANACRCIILMADHREEKEVRDAYQLQALLVLRSKGWPRTGHILLECSLTRNQPDLQTIGGERTDIVILDRWLARLMVQVSQQHGLGDVIQKTFSTCGDTFHIEPCPKELIGRKFSELPFHYPLAIPLGTIAGREPSLGHANDRTLQEGEDLILLGHTKSNVRDNYTVERFCNIEALQGVDRPRRLPRLDDAAETIIVVGWGALMGPFLIQLDIECAPSTRVIIVSPRPVETRQAQLIQYERRWQHKFEHVKFEHVAGMLGSPTVWDRVDVKDATRIFIFADISAKDQRQGDACTVAAVVQLRSIVKERNPRKCIPIIPEVQDPRTEELCRICQVSSYVDTSGMPAQVLALVSVEPRIRLALKDLVGADAKVGYVVRQLSDYTPEKQSLPKGFSFMQAQELVNQAGDVLVGWTAPTDDQLFAGGRHASVSASSAALVSSCELFASGFEDYEWELNPIDKLKKRSWSGSDRFVVIGVH